MPLARNPTPIPDMTTATLVELARSTAAHSAGALAALALALVLLLAFILWRLALGCRTCCCPRRRPLAPTSKAAAAAAHAILRGRCTRWLKGGLVLCALGVLGGSIYGFTQLGTDLAGEARAVVDSIGALGGSVLTAGHGVQGALSEASHATLALMQQLGSVADPAAAAAMQPSVDGMAAAQASMAAAAGALDQALPQLESGLAQLQRQANGTYLPLARSAETLVQGVLYAAFALLAALSLVAAAGAAANWPAIAKPTLALLLLLTLLAWVLAAALTALLHVGASACAGLEPLLLSLSGDNDLVRYYLLGPTDGSSNDPASLLAGMLGGGVDAAAAGGAAAQALANLQAALQLWPPLAAAAAPAADEVAAQLGELTASLEAFNAAAGYPAVHQVFAAAKSWLCCSLLDGAGALWAALLAAGACSLALLLLAFAWLGRMDRLAAAGGPQQQFGCCHMHSVRDWSLEGQRSQGEEALEERGGRAAAGAKPGGKASGGGGGGGGTSGAPLPDLKLRAPQDGSEPSSPTGQLRIKSWASDLASAPPSPPARSAASASAASASINNDSPLPPPAVGVTAGSPSRRGLPARALSLPAARAAAGRSQAPRMMMPSWAALEPVVETDTQPKGAEEPETAAAAAYGPSAPTAPPAQQLVTELDAADEGEDEGEAPLVQGESSAPPLPLAGEEGSLEALSGAARTAAELAGQAFSVASRAQAMLSDAARIARASLSGGQAAAAAAAAESSQQGTGADAGRRPASASPLGRQASSRIPRPYLNY